MKLAHPEHLDEIRQRHPEKFVAPDQAFGRIHRGDRIFIATACGEPQYLVRSLVQFVEHHPKAIFDAEVLHVWTLGVAPYADAKFKANFRHNSFFVGGNTREAVNACSADYTPIFLSQVPGLFATRHVQVDVALVQLSPPDRNGYMSLGVSVDITRAAVEDANLVIAQVNRHMPRVHGDAFVHVSEVDFLVPFDEPLLTYEDSVPDEEAQRIGRYVSRIVRHGDTIQVGYGSLPNAIVANLKDKKHLGVHTELLTDGIAELMAAGVVDNTRKEINRKHTVATFCMGRPETYAFVHDNPSVVFRGVDYTNDPTVISRHENMVAINSALEIDLTGQATAESIGSTFYSGIGGQADFMRGSVLARHGRTILALLSTARDGTVSRIVPQLSPGAGVTLGRGDVHYVVTEFGIAYLHGKNIRERAMALIAIAHPDHRAWLVEEAKKLRLVYPDQAYEEGSVYPEELETWRTTAKGIEVFLRPVKISDEPLLKAFFTDLSDRSLELRFLSQRHDMPHERLQQFTAVDFQRDMVLLAVAKEGERAEQVLAVGQFALNRDENTAEVAFAVADGHQGRGMASTLLNELTLLARKRGLAGFTAEVEAGNGAMLAVFRKMNYQTEQRMEMGTVALRMMF